MPHAELSGSHDAPVLSPIARYCANAEPRPVRQKVLHGWGLHDRIGVRYGTYGGGIGKVSMESEYSTVTLLLEGAEPYQPSTPLAKES